MIFSFQVESSVLTFQGFPVVRSLDKAPDFRGIVAFFGAKDDLGVAPSRIILCH